MLPFAGIPLSSLLLLCFAALLFALCPKRGFAALSALGLSFAAVTLALLANADKILLAGAILLSLSLGLALREGRDRS